MTKIKSYLKKTNKLSLIVLVIIWLLSLVAFVNSVILNDWFKISLAFAALVLYFVPIFANTVLSVKLPTTLEISYYLFIFASLILGEVFAFYGPYPFWDIILHFISGFMLAGIGLSIIQIGGHNKTSRFIALLFAFCFSITLGAAWECLEFSFDQIVRTDAQKDAHLTSLSTITMQRDGGNRPVHVDNIDHTNIHLKNGETITIDEGYLDIGLIDTMKDLLVNTAGAMLFVFFGIISNTITKNFSVSKQPTKQT